MTEDNFYCEDHPAILAIGQSRAVICRDFPLEWAAGLTTLADRLANDSEANECAEMIFRHEDEHCRLRAVMVTADRAREFAGLRMASLVPDDMPLFELLPMAAIERVAA